MVKFEICGFEIVRFAIYKTKKKKLEKNLK